MPRRGIVLAIAFAGVSVSVGASALVKGVVGDKRSGYVFATPETREMMDDDFNNPGFLWIETGEAQWRKPEGADGRSCESCHRDARTTMKGIAASYPKFDAHAGRVIDLEQRINLCRSTHMQASDLPWESDQLLGLTGYVKLQSRGLPVAVSPDGPAAASWANGKAFYYRRRGQLDLACASCHEENQGRHIRSEVLSQGQSNGFPLYRLKWQGFGSAQRRFSGCNEEIRAEPFPLGSQDYVDLELYVAWRGNGLPIETPAVRK